MICINVTKIVTVVLDKIKIGKVLRTDREKVRRKTDLSNVSKV